MKLALNPSEIPYAKKLIARHDQVARHPWIITVTFVIILLVQTILAIMSFKTAANVEQLNDEFSAMDTVGVQSLEDMKCYVDLKDQLCTIHQKTLLTGFSTSLNIGMLIVAMFLYQSRRKLEPMDVKLYRALIDEHEHGDALGHAQTGERSIRE